MNMFKPTSAKTTKEYFDMLTPERKKQMKLLDQFIKKTAPSLKPVFVSNMPGYGVFSYTNSKKQTFEWPVVAVASQKNYISVYVCSIDKGEYVAEKFAKDLGKVSVGRSCIRFKNIEDVNLKTLEKVIKIAAKKPGLK